MTLFSRCKLLAVIIGILVLAGCASKPAPLNLPVGWHIQKQQLEAMENWQVSGKLAYRAGDEAFSANLRWQEAPKLSSLKLFTTLGISVVDMQVTEQLTTLEADGDIYQDSDPQVLLERVTGWNIPVSQLRNWVKGLPADDDTLVFNDNGTIKTLSPSCAQCGNWVVEYSRFMQVDELILPNALTIRDVSQPNAFIKLRISSWR